jgi:menaquinone-9 beta-reductase
VRVHLEGSERLLARAIVGADGVGGPVRRSAGFSRGRLRAQAVEVDTEPSAGDAPRDALHFDFGDPSLRGYAWDFPTLVAGRPMTCRGVYRIVLPGERDDPQERLRRFLAAKGIALEDHRVKQLAERGFDPKEPISKPHVLLVGEAAGIDVATGEGIAQAIAYGALAGRYLARAFRRGDLEFADWLEQVHEDGVGRQLRARLWAYGRFFGEDRVAMERVLSRSPEALRIAMKNFAGTPNGALAWAKALSELGPALLEHGPDLVVRTLRSALPAPGGLP